MMKAIYLVLAAFLSLTACSDVRDAGDASNLPSCTAGPLLLIPPVNVSDVRNFIPRGNLNPSAHVFPTEHSYFYLNTETDVLMPGDGWVTQVLEQTQTYAGGSTYVDYAITLHSCRDYKIVFGHLTSLSSEFQNLINQGGGSCEEYDTGGYHYRQCRYSLERFYNAGTVLGRATYSLDFGAFDRRQPPLQWVGQSYIMQRDELPYSACLEDEYDASAWAAISTVNPRTTPPLCGKIDLDVAGTAQGIWFRQGVYNLYPEDPHLGLVYDFIDPAKGAISIGTSLPTAQGVHFFTPTSMGDVNRKFDTITPGNTIYCYTSATGGAILLQLPVDRRLLLEHQSTTSCSSSPFNLTNSAVTFVR